MSPFDIYQLAERLVQKEPVPEGFRCSISRAYYAAFLHARGFILKAGFTFPSGRKERLHRDIPIILSGSGDPVVCRIGDSLGNLREHRNSADYDLADKIIELRSSAEARLKEAQEIMMVLSTCETEPTRYEKVKKQVCAEANRLIKGT